MRAYESTLKELSYATKLVTVAQFVQKWHKFKEDWSLFKNKEKSSMRFWMIYDLRIYDKKITS